VVTAFGGFQPTRTQVWRGDGTGALVAPALDTGVPIVGGLTVADLDQDGTLDLSAATTSPRCSREASAAARSRSRAPSRPASTRR
jgi:hypothetical protein